MCRAGGADGAAWAQTINQITPHHPVPQHQHPTNMGRQYGASVMLGRVPQFRHQYVYTIFETSKKRAYTGAFTIKYFIQKIII